MNKAYRMSYWDYVISKWQYDAQYSVTPKFIGIALLITLPVICAFSWFMAAISPDVIYTSIALASTGCLALFTASWLIKPYLIYSRLRGDCVFETNKDGIIIHNDENTAFCGWGELSKMYVNKRFIYFFGKTQYITLPKKYIDKDQLLGAVPMGEYGSELNPAGIFYSESSTIKETFNNFISLLKGKP